MKIFMNYTRVVTDLLRKVCSWFVLAVLLAISNSPQNHGRSVDTANPTRDSI